MAGEPPVESALSCGFAVHGGWIGWWMLLLDCLEVCFGGRGSLRESGKAVGMIPALIPLASRSGDGSMVRVYGRTAEYHASRSRPSSTVHCRVIGSIDTAFLIWRLK